MQIKKSDRGFTLVEVLVATVILFSALTAISLSYRGSLQSAQRAEEHVLLASAMPVILSQVRQQIRYGTPADNELMQSVRGVSYEYSTARISEQPPQPFYNTSTGQFETFPRLYALLEVTLTVKTENLSQQHQFYEVSWYGTQ